MGIKNLFHSQLSTVIQWADDDGAFWYKYPSKHDEIINASKLIVAPGQGAVLVYEGEVVDVIEEAGSFNLKTDNHPFFTNLVRLRQGFESEHKLKIYFFRKTQVLNQLWGTASPVKLIDKQYRIPVELGVNGNFSYRMAAAQLFLTGISGGRDEYATWELSEVLTDRIVQSIIAELHQAEYSYVQIDAHLGELAEALKSTLAPVFQQMGLELTDFRILGTQFDEETRARIGRIADVTTDAQAAQEAGLTYAELEKLRALRDAARNEGGLAGTGVQMGVGIEMGRQMGAVSGSADRNAVAQSQTTNEELAQRLNRLKILLDEHVITQEDYEQMKRQLLLKP